MLPNKAVWYNNSWSRGCPELYFVYVFIFYPVVNTWFCLLSSFMTSYMTIFWCSIIDKCQLNSRTWTTEESHSGLVASDLLNLTYNHMYVCCLLFSVRLENISLILRHRHCEWGAAEFMPGAWYLWPLSRKRSLSCHTGFDTGLRFFAASSEGLHHFNSLFRHAKGTKDLHCILTDS